MTINTSPHGFGFFTKIDVKEGQTITIIKLTRKGTMSDFSGQKARVIWVKKGSSYVEAGARLIRTGETV